MMFPKSTGSFKSHPPTVKIQRQVEVDEQGNEIPGTESFYLVDKAGKVLKGPFSTWREALDEKRAYLKQLAHG